MRKNRLLVIGLLSCWIVGLTGCAKQEIKNTDSKGKNIICFGDSITAGYGAGPGEDYPAQLAKLVNMPVINAGVSADTSFEGLKRIKQDVLDKDPYLVIIEFCGNDFLNKIPRQDTIANILKMAEAAQDQGAIVAIVDISAGMFLSEYRSSFGKLARQTGSIFIPSVLQRLLTNPSMKSDFFHPNSAGYKLVAERIRKVIHPYLKD